LRQLRFWLYGLFAALLSGCTATFTYNHLDWLIPWYVNGYVDLTREQRQILQGRLEPLLQWHREEELARYIDLIGRIESDLESPVSAVTVQEWIDEIADAAERTERSMLSLALEFGSTISNAQMAEFIASLREQQRDFEREFLERSDQAYSDDSYQSLSELLSRFVGRLTPEQKRRLRSAADALRRFDSAWLEERAQWLSTLEPLLDRQPGWQTAVQSAYFTRKRERTPRYRETLAFNLSLVSQATADVLNQLSGKQRLRAARELDKLRERLTALSADAHLTLQSRPIGEKNRARPDRPGPASLENYGRRVAGSQP